MRDLISKLTLANSLYLIGGSGNIIIEGYNKKSKGEVCFFKPDFCTLVFTVCGVRVTSRIVSFVAGWVAMCVYYREYYQE